MQHEGEHAKIFLARKTGESEFKIRVVDASNDNIYAFFYKHNYFWRLGRP